MPAARETIWNALQAVLAGVAGVVTCERKWQAISTVVPDMLPAIFIVELYDKRDTKSVAGMPPRLILYADLHVMTYQSDLIHAAVSSPMNPILDGIDAALLPVPGLANTAATLTGIVTKVTASGAGHVYEGVAEGFSYCVVPIEIVATI